MNNTNNTNSIGIYFCGLEVKERAIFDRVIAFNVTHGQTSHICDNPQSSDLVICAEKEFSILNQNIQQQKILVLSANPSCTLGDAQVKRPLLITRAMKALESAIKQIDKKPTKDLNNEQPIANDTLSNIENTTKANSSNEIKEELQKPEKHSGHHALVIDDSASIRKQLELELRDAGISADFAESGEQALEKIEENQYDLVFLDIIMPGIDGYETCRAMRAKASYKRTPIIMLSGKTSPLDEVQGVIAGATTYLTKPVKSVMLQETLSRVTKWLNNFADNDKNKDSIKA